MKTALIYVLGGVMMLVFVATVWVVSVYRKITNRPAPYSIEEL